MKRFLCILIPALLAAPIALRAQDAATQAQLDKLQGHIDELLAANAALQKRVLDLTSQVNDLRQMVSAPNTNYASLEDVNRLAKQLQEVDQKRQEDKDLILQKIEQLGKALGSAPRGSSMTSGTDSSAGPSKGFEYVIQSGDTLSAIVQAYRLKNIKVTVDQILKANPGLDPTKMQVGQKIFIPAP